MSQDVCFKSNSRNMSSEDFNIVSPLLVLSLDVALDQSKMLLNQSVAEVEAVNYGG